MSEQRAYQDMFMEIEIQKSVHREEASKPWAFIVCSPSSRYKKTTRDRTVT